jgi:hypothetical protein
MSGKYFQSELSVLNFKEMDFLSNQGYWVIFRFPNLKRSTQAHSGDGLRGC